MSNLTTISIKRKILLKQTILPVGMTLIKEINIFDKKAEERNGELKLKHKQQKGKQFSIECVRSCDQQPYLFSKTKESFALKKSLIRTGFIYVTS